jgi:hypothetical protein
MITSPPSSAATKAESNKIEDTLHHRVAHIRPHKKAAGAIFMQAAELEMQSQQ